MSLTRNQLVIIGVGLVIAIVIVVLFFFGGTSTTRPRAVKLTVFGTEDSKVMGGLIDAYKAVAPNVAINYTQFSNASYEKELLNSLASGQGPDIFEIADTNLPVYADKLATAPASELSPAAINLFPRVVSQAFVENNAIYALPLTIDTLALFYNRDLLSAKGIAVLPRTWKDFQAVIPALRATDPGGRLTRAAAAIGGSAASIVHAADILNLIFLQSGVPAVAEDGTVKFGDKGLQALDFYLDFANPASNAYTWDDGLTSSFDLFLQGNAAMIFGYAKDLAVFKAKAPFVSIGVTPAPQIDVGRPVEAARFNGWGVSRRSLAPAWAWNFIIQAATNPALSEPVAQALGQSPALLALIQKYENDPALGIFAWQALNASQWREPDDSVVRQAFSQAIHDVLAGKLTSRQALSQAEEEINSRR